MAPTALSSGNWTSQSYSSSKYTLLRTHNCSQQHQWFITQWMFHLWILFAFLVIMGSESGEGSSSALFSTDEVLGTAEALESKCSFPSHWIGNWFQSGVTHRISISHSTISTKGKCLEAEGEKYIVYEPRLDCYKCLVFNEKHANVLKYKETYCNPRRGTLQHLCSTIPGDANLYEMFRLDADPIDCPLKGPFSFSYDRGYGECRYPESTLDSCTLKSRLLFNYQACPDVPKTESVEEELQCLASWKEGSSRYFLALNQSPHHSYSSYEERFRCYAYERHFDNGGARNHHNGHNHHHGHNQHPQTLALGGKNRPRPYQGVTMVSTSSGNNFGGPSASEVWYRVVQSGDATCNGLSTMEGSRTMFLRKVQEPEAECQFPPWIQTHPQWHSLDQSTIYEFDGLRLKVTNRTVEQSENANEGDSLAMSGSCRQLLSDETGYSAKLILHAKAGCKIGYRCVVLHKRDSDILEVQFGEWSRKHEEACDNDVYFDPYRQPYVTLISSTPKSSQCPTLGKYSFKISPEQEMRRRMSSRTTNFQQGSCTANGTLRMGCSSLDSLQLEISSQCHDNNQDQQPTTPGYTRNREVTDYTCHGWFEEDGVTYMVATLSAIPNFRGTRHCFVIRDLSSPSPPRMGFTRAQEGQQMQMSPFRQHSNGAAGQHVAEVVGGSSSTGSQGSYGNSHHHPQTDSETPTSSSAALFFFNNNNQAVGRILEISSFADSCRRNVVVGEEGDFTYNATKIGHCFASSSSPSVITRGGSISAVGMVTIGGIVTISADLLPIPQLAWSWILPVAVGLMRLW